MSTICNWNYPTAIKVGENALHQLPELLVEKNISTIFFVIDPFIEKLEIVQTLLNTITKQFHLTIFNSFQANPTEQDVINGSNLLVDTESEIIIGIGGGSALDVAKSIALFAKQGLTIWQLEDIGDNFKLADPELILPIIAIPTTAGTGSEVGRASVIIDQNDKVKRLLFHPKMLPSHVILDPLLTLSVPTALTAATGMDAFAHNLEAFLAPGYHPMADGIALEGMRLIKENLPEAFNNGQNIEARQNLLVASSMGATAFQKGLGVIHSLSHPIGAMFNHHHGFLNAILTPYSLIFNREKIEQKCCQIAKYLNLKELNFESFLEYTISLLQTLQLPLTLEEIGMRAEDADEIAKKALADPSCATNPKPLDLNSLKQIYLNALYGKR